jgi:predicted ribosomally synthesized peptide with SipW-like signal peptide
MKKLALSLVTLGISTSLLIGLTNAYFSDTETSTDNILQAGAFDLLIDGKNNPTAIVNFLDFKPGDNYIEEKTVTLQNPGYVWMHLIDYETGQGTETEPEILEENGTPKFDIDKYITYDLSTPTASGSSALIHQDNNIPFPDVFSCWIPLGTFPAGTSSIFQSFHFDPTVTNWAQGDTLTFSEEFYAVQSRNNPSPTPPASKSGRVWNANTTKCENCVNGEAYPQSVVLSETFQGTKKNNTAITDPNRTNPNNALVKDWINNGTTGFFSIGKGGKITVEFAQPVVNDPGTDLRFYEATNGRIGYPLETAEIKVSFDGITYYSIGSVGSEPSGDGVEELDITPSGLLSIKYVQVIDTTNYNLHASDADGYDLDAIQALNQCILQN